MNEFYFVEYNLFGMQKNIIFQTFSQYTAWVDALTALDKNFEVYSIKESRY